LPSQQQVYTQGCFLASVTQGFGKFESGDGTISANLVEQGQTGQGLRLDFSVSNEPSSYSGWQVLLGDSNLGIDLSSRTSLTFAIRGKEGGETANVWLMMPIMDGKYERFYKRLEVLPDWQQFTIPLTHFESGTEKGEQVNLAKIHRIQFVFEWRPEPTVGTIYMDNLCIE